MKRGRFLLTVVGLGLVLCTSAGAATIIADGDTYVDPEQYNYQGTPLATWDYNYGGQVYLNTGGYYSAHNVIYVHFDVSSLAGEYVVDGRLKLDHYSHSWTGSGDYTQDIQVFAILDESDDWDTSAIPQGTGTGSNTAELDLVAANAPQRGPNGPILNNEGTTTASASYRIATIPITRNSATNDDYSLNVDVTALLNWMLGWDPNYTLAWTETDLEITFAIHLAYRGGYPYMSAANWKSLEYTPTDSTDAPRLEVTVFEAPEPATMSLLCVGAIGVLAARRRRMR